MANESYRPQTCRARTNRGLERENAPTRQLRAPVPCQSAKQQCRRGTHMLPRWWSAGAAPFFEDSFGRELSVPRLGRESQCNIVKVVAVIRFVLHVDMFRLFVTLSPYVCRSAPREYLYHGHAGHLLGPEACLVFGAPFRPGDTRSCTPTCSSVRLWPGLRRGGFGPLVDAGALGPLVLLGLLLHRHLASVPGPYPRMDPFRPHCERTGHRRSQW